jgi:alanyl-tRNA synthetase
MRVGSINSIVQKYKERCKKEGIEFSVVDSVKSPDETTLFCCSGMQQYKNKFEDKSVKNLTIGNIQPCIRLDDLKEIGDGNHFLYFNMIGFFSFRDWSVKRVIKFWMEFMEELKIKVETVTIHPSKMLEWKRFYDDYDVEIISDKECIWTDRNSGGYCTEFYSNGIEIGNIVNNSEDCIDVGFGLERLDMISNGTKPKDKLEILKDTIEMIIKSGYYPSNKKQGYILRKLLRSFYQMGGKMNHQFFKDEIERQKKILERYNKLKDKNKNKTKEWWFDTHGINIDELNS